MHVSNITEKKKEGNSWRKLMKTHQKTLKSDEVFSVITTSTTFSFRQIDTDASVAPGKAINKKINKSLSLAVSFQNIAKPIHVLACMSAKN